jgi:hypothetical protein
MMRGMRLRAAVLTVLLLLGVSACAEDNPAADSAPVIPAPGETSSEVPGTRPSPAQSTSSPEPTVSPTAGESPTATAAPTPISTESIAATPETLDGYRALATGIGAFFTTARQMEEKHPDADPQNADEVDELLGDVYPGGVDLVVFDVADAGLTVCLTGPAATFLLLTGHDEGIRQLFGGGDCQAPQSIDAEAGADVVVDVTFGLVGDEPHTKYVGTVVKGQNLADQIEDLDTWIQVLNEDMAR